MMLPLLFAPNSGVTIEGGQGALKRHKSLKNKAPETRTDRISGGVEATSQEPAGGAQRTAPADSNA